jgi:hypothetical protein
MAKFASIQRYGRIAYPTAARVTYPGMGPFTVYQGNPLPWLPGSRSPIAAPQPWYSPSASWPWLNSGAGVRSTAVNFVMTSGN